MFGLPIEIVSVVVGTALGWFLASAGTLFGASNSRRRILKRAYSKLVFVQESISQLANSDAFLKNFADSPSTAELIRNQTIKRYLSDQNILELVDEVIVEAMDYLPLFAVDLREMRRLIFMAINSSLGSIAKAHETAYSKSRAVHSIGLNILNELASKAINRIAWGIGPIFFLQSSYWLKRRRARNLKRTQDSLATAAPLTTYLFDTLIKPKNHDQTSD